jgi:hypothetical protein
MGLVLLEAAADADVQSAHAIGCAMPAPGRCCPIFGTRRLGARHRCGSIKRKDTQMTRRILTSLGAATILASVLAAAPVRVHAQAGSPFQRSGDSGSEDTAMDPCLPPNPNAAVGVSSARDFSRRGSFRRRPIPPLGRKGALAFARTELFFGTDKPDGVVTDEQFQAFLDNQITPRFPDGLTVVKGDGQFRDSTGEIIKEASFILILLYPIESVKDSSRRIESIRRCYLLQFQQESVLRVDDPFASWVSF